MKILIEDFNYTLYADVDCKEDALIIQQIEDSNDDMIDKNQIEDFAIRNGYSYLDTYSDYIKYIIDAFFGSIAEFNKKDIQMQADVLWYGDVESLKSELEDQTMMDFINDPFYVKETAEAISAYILSLKDSNRYLHI